MRQFLFLLFLLAPFYLFSQQNIPVGPGPEDFVLDTLTGPARFLVSCAQRRKSAEPYNEIRVVNPENLSVETLRREGEPPGWSLHFHGMDLVRNNSGTPMLYLISHGLYEGDERNFILVYELKREAAVFRDSLFHFEILKSPNDVCALPDGSVYATNDYGYKFSMVIRSIFKCRVSTVALYRNGEWKIAADKLRFANGILKHNQKMYVSETIGGKIFEYDFEADGSLSKRRTLVEKLNGLDNLTYHDGFLYTARHPATMKFMRHKGNSAHPSPSIALKVKLESGIAEEIFQDDGQQFSAASTAIWFEGRLYLSQVLDGNLFLIQE